MDQKKIIVVFILLALLSIGIKFIAKQKSGGLDEKQVVTVQQKTYEQGLWDGFNGAFKYLDYTHQIKDTLHIEITIADSILHAKKQ